MVFGGFISRDALHVTQGPAVLQQLGAGWSKIILHELSMPLLGMLRHKFKSLGLLLGLTRRPSGSQARMSL